MDCKHNCGKISRCSLLKAREKSLKPNWMDFSAVQPTFLGHKVYKNFPLADLVPFIDWKCFFDVWELRGRYPNGRYPKIFDDGNVGKKLNFLNLRFFKVN